MKIEYDPEADAAYIYLEYPVKPGEVKQTMEIKEGILLDFDGNHKILGIEILNAKQVLAERVLLEAQPI